MEEEKKVSGRARRNKVREEITILLRLCEWRGPSLSAVCCPLPGESTTSLPRVSAAGRQRAAEEGRRLSTASSKSGQPLLFCSALNMFERHRRQTAARPESEDRTGSGGAGGGATEAPLKSGGAGGSTEAPLKSNASPPTSRNVFI